MDPLARQAALQALVFALVWTAIYAGWTAYRDGWAAVTAGWPGLVTGALVGAVAFGVATYVFTKRQTERAER